MDTDSSVLVERVCFKIDDDDVQDSNDKYNVDNVSYGSGGSATMTDLTLINFEVNEVTTARVDERNLILCKYMNMIEAANSTHLETKHLTSLRLLVIQYTNIIYIDAVLLTRIENIYVDDFKLA